MVRVRKCSGTKMRSIASVIAIGAVLAAMPGCGFGGSNLSGTSDDEMPAEVSEAYEALSGRPFPDDVDILGWEYDYGWLDDALRVVVETTPERADELAALEQDDDPDEAAAVPSIGVSDEQIDAALKRQPVRSYDHQEVGAVTKTVILGQDDTVTVVLIAFEM